jgi:hypothetical protein
MNRLLVDAAGAVMGRRGLLVGLATVAVLPSFGVSAQGSKVSSSADLDIAAATLRPGQWVWAPEVAPAGPMLIYVDLSRQIATVYRNGVRIGVSTISSGKAGHETPTGVFTILQKDANHHSNKYNDAPMPFQERLTWDGVALHAGGLPGYPESHGCVHLPYAFAKALFSETRLGVTVVMAGDAINHQRTSDASLLEPTVASIPGDKPLPLGPVAFRWTPELSPTGPLTIIISKHDQAIVVLRNGVEIGRSEAQIDDDDPGSHVVTMTEGPDGRPRFIYVGLPGHDEDQGKPLDEAELNRVRLPKAFLEDIKAELEPGTTILITEASVGEDTGKHITIIDAVPPEF